MSNFDETNFHVHTDENIDDDFVNTGSKVGFTKPRLVKGDVCKLFCRGDKCSKCAWYGQYSGIEAAIDGLYSSWITDNILAMARPNNKSLKEGLLNQFQENGIRTVINMQISGEHAHCGYGNVTDTGFSYSPELFMDRLIDYCNYPCEDFGVISIVHLLDIVKLFQHRLSLGKVAVHCHAGLGRTGIVIACLLIYNNRMSGEDAVNYVRQKRPKSIQNTVQVDQVLNFAKYLQPLRTIYYIRSDDSVAYPFSLKESTLRQRNFIHGHEASLLHCVPKVLFVCLKRLSDIATQKKRSTRNGGDVSSISSSDQTSVVDGIQNSSFKQETFLKWFKRMAKYFSSPFTERVTKKFCKAFSTPYEDKETLLDIKKRLNSTNEVWTELRLTNDIHLICQLICDWLKELKFPLLRLQDLNVLSMDDVDPLEALLNLESCISRTLTMLLLFLNQLDLNSEGPSCRGSSSRNQYGHWICLLFYQLITHKYPESDPHRTERFVLQPHFPHSSLSRTHIDGLDQVRCDLARRLSEI